MKLTIHFLNGKTKTISISTNCSTETFISKIEKWEYRKDVVKVVAEQKEISCQK